MGHLALLLRRLIGTPLALEPDTLEALLLVASARGADLAQAAIVLPSSGRVASNQRAAAALAAAGRSRPGLPERLRADALLTSPSGGASSDQGDVVVIDVQGELVGRSVGASPMSGDFQTYSALTEKVNAAASDPRIRGIVLNLDSPGGEMHGSFDAADAIRAATRTKPVVALANPYAMSAAYLLASAASQIVVPPTGSVGSVGVYTAHMDQSEADKAAGLKFSFISAGKHKLDGNPHEALPDDVRARLQAQVDQAYGLFTGAVAGYRPGLTVGRLQELGADRFRGQEAVDAGMADHVGNLSLAVELASRPRPFPVGQRASARAFPRRTA